MWTSHQNKIAWTSDARSIIWNKVVLADDVDSMVDKFNATFNQLYDKHAPMAFRELLIG